MLPTSDTVLSALHELGRSDLAEDWLKHGPATRYERQRTHLHELMHMCRDADTDSATVARALSALIDGGTDPNGMTRFGRTPLGILLYGTGDRTEVLRALLDAGAVPAEAVPEPPLAKLFSTRLKDPRTLWQMLTDAGADPTHPAVLLAAIRSGGPHRTIPEHFVPPSLPPGAPFLDVVRALLDAGADPNLGPLHKAVEADDHELVQLLLDRGADPKGMCWHRVGTQPIHHANSTAMLDRLERAGADLLSGNDRGDDALTTYLHRQPERWNRASIKEFVEYLVRAGLDLSKSAALNVAAQEQQDAVVRLLLDHGADPLVPYLVVSDDPATRDKIVACGGVATEPDNEDLAHCDRMGPAATMQLDDPTFRSLGALLVNFGPEPPEPFSMYDARLCELLEADPSPVAQLLREMPDSEDSCYLRHAWLNGGRDSLGCDILQVAPPDFDLVNALLDAGLSPTRESNDGRTLFEALFMHAAPSSLFERVAGPVRGRCTSGLREVRKSNAPLVERFWDLIDLTSPHNVAGIVSLDRPDLLDAIPWGPRLMPGEFFYKAKGAPASLEYLRSHPLAWPE